MEIKTKYELYDIVYFFVEDDIKTGQIIEIIISKSGISYIICYSSENSYQLDKSIKKEEIELFSTKEDILKMKIAKNNLEIEIQDLINHFARDFNIDIVDIKYNEGKIILNNGGLKNV